MENLQGKSNEQKLSYHGVSGGILKPDCTKCFGYCCVALYFSASEGFPMNKDAGEPCPNLQCDFSCKVHNNLGSLGFKGCAAYDCFGAGQKTAQITYEGRDWRKAPESAKVMYESFLIIRQLHEMLWYLADALSQQLEHGIEEELRLIAAETEKLTQLSPENLSELNLEAHRAKVNVLLSKVSEKVRARSRKGKTSTLKGRKILGRGLDLIGKDLRKVDLKGENFRGALIIAANLSGADLSGADFIGADLRDANLSGANLTRSIFITQGQINTAKGDVYTRLPSSLTAPEHWIR